MKSIRPHGEWESPIGAAEVARSRLRLAHPTLRSGVVWWQENRPEDGGRTAVMRRTPDGVCASVLPAGFEARTRVHEYGGLSYFPLAGDKPGEWSVAFADHATQRLHLVRSAAADVAVPLTPSPPVPAGLRYADFVLSPDATELWCVRESHLPQGPPRRALVAVPLDGSAAEAPEAVRELMCGSDFLAYPTPSPDGTHLAWIGWDRPDMPWDRSALYVARLDGGGASILLGGPRESVLAPVWRDDGSLYVVSDRSGWWNLCLVDLAGRVEHVYEIEEEFAEPLWGLGGRPFTQLSDGRLAVLHGRGQLGLGVLDAKANELVDVPTTWTSFGPALSAEGGTVCAIAHAPDKPGGVVVVDLGSGDHDLIRVESDHVPPVSYLPVPEAVEFIDADGQPVHAFRYPPTNPEFRGPDGEAPPYVVWAHGGPTGHGTSDLDLTKAFFTSRGIGVLDVNYGGSSGYGRTYRNRLLGNWGVTDADDVVAAARALADLGLADGERLAVRGGSAGGWTALVAVTSAIPRVGAVFRAATAYFGVTDVVTLAEHTHDFEAGYFDALIGPLESSAEVYRARSPRGSISAETCPVLLLQGLRDPVVPPAQAVALLGELADSGVDHVYLAFAGESHGFRRADTIRACLEAELGFYGRALGFTPVVHGASPPEG